MAARPAAACHIGGMPPTTRTLIVDDEDDVRLLVRATIERANEGLAVAGEAASGAEALAQWRQHRPEVVVLDQRMPDATGLEVAERILAEYPEQHIILFSAYLSEEVVNRASQLGITTCLSKDQYRAIPELLWRHARGG